jgi:hypothetical protein
VSTGKLHLKRTIWVAGFPKNNRIISIEPISGEDKNLEYINKFKDTNTEIEDVHENYKIRKHNDIVSNPKAINDYVGIYIDAGFRLTKYSALRKCCISVELAYLISDILEKKSKTAEIKIYYDGGISLKGVFDGIDYPCFWVDTQKDNPSYNAIDRLDHRNLANLSDVKTVVETFIDKVSQYTCIPYIVCCSYGKIPDDHQKFIEGLKI